MLSAYGLALADVVEEVQEPCSLRYEQKSFGELDRRMEQLSERCHHTLRGRGFTRSEATEMGVIFRDFELKRGVVVAESSTTHNLSANRLLVSN